MILSELHNRPIARRVIPDEEQAEIMAQYGVPTTAIDITLAMYRGARAGEFAAVDRTLEHLIHRAPMTVRDVLHKGRL